jgi:uncharacterized membrane protein
MTRAELLTMLHVLGVIAWLGAGIGLLVLNWLALRARDPAGLATLVRQSETLGASLFGPASLLTAAAGVALVATEAAFGFGDLWILIGIGGILVSPILQSTVARRARARFLTLVAGQGADPARLVAAARRVTLLNTVDVFLLVVVVWAMFAKPVL